MRDPQQQQHKRPGTYAVASSQAQHAELCCVSLREEDLVESPHFPWTAFERGRVLVAGVNFHDDTLEGVVAPGGRGGKRRRLACFLCSLRMFVECCFYVLLLSSPSLMLMFVSMSMSMSML